MEVSPFNQDRLSWPNCPCSNQTSAFALRAIALCCYPNVKVEFRDSGQICTTAPIFLKSNYFRQNIWKSPAAQFHFSFIFGYELNTINCSYEIYKENQLLQARCKKDCGDKLNTILKTVCQIFLDDEDIRKIFVNFRFHFDHVGGLR